MASLLASDDVVLAVDSLYILLCCGLLVFVVLGIMLFYAGLIQRRSSLTMIATPLYLICFTFIEWFIWGYSLCYSSSSNRFIGNLDYAVLRQLRHDGNLKFTTLRGETFTAVHFLFNALMKIICVTLTFPGCIAERGRILPMFVFFMCWLVIIYNPVTYWFWNRNGWLSVEYNKFPVLDFAGGNCIHIVCGFTGVAYSYILGPRNPKLLYNYKPYNIGYIVIGTVFFVFGWCGFIGGCEFTFSSSSVLIFITTVLTSCVGGLVWLTIDYYYSAIPLENEDELQQQTSNTLETTGSIPQLIPSRSRDMGVLRKRRSPSMEGSRRSMESHTSQLQLLSVVSRNTGLDIRRYKEQLLLGPSRKLSMVSFCSGAMAGLVCFTPGGGYVVSLSSLWKSFVYGVVGAVVGNVATRLKYMFRLDDVFDLAAIHLCCGWAGSLLTGIFADANYNSEGGWIRAHWIQFAYQILGSTVTSVYVLVMSSVLLYVIDVIPGLHLRIDKNFNARLRQEIRKMHNSEKGDGEATDEKNNYMDENNAIPELEDHEELELMGTDEFEFNGEFISDYVEFIRVLSPEDYEAMDELSDGVGEPTNQMEVFGSHPDSAGYTSDFSQGRILDNGITKRE